MRSPISCEPPEISIFTKTEESRVKVFVGFFVVEAISVDWMEKMRPLTLLLLRVGLGVIFIHNGYPKFVGRRQEHLDEMVHINHLPAYFAYIAGVLEVGGGALLIGGLFTRIMGFLLACEMAVAMWKGEQFFDNPWAVGKYELALALGVGALALATFGAGVVSLDAAIFGSGGSRRGTKSRG